MINKTVKTHLGNISLTGLGNALKEKRSMMNCNQSDLAKLTGLTNVDICKIENALTEPSSFRLLKLGLIVWGDLNVMFQDIILHSKIAKAQVRARKRIIKKAG